MENKLKEMSLHLLDLGKRNRLLNYKQHTLKTVDVLNENLEVIFNKITNSSKLSIFKIDNEFLNLEEEIDPITRIKEKTLPLLKANDILCYKKDYNIKKVLKSIYKEYKDTLLERGINTLYMTFGLVSYPFKKEHYLAPLLLIPIECKFENETYSIHEHEDEIILNPTLAYLLKNEYHLELEDYVEKEMNFVDYFSLISDKLKDYGMELRLHSSIGIYSFLKMNMFNDINENSNLIIQNKNMQALLGQPVEESEEITDDISYPVVNADSSQMEAIRYAVSGKSFVLQGPPGSGKSQTITNIIASMLGNGKKVLFVSEKQAALNVVYENLKRVGLDSFALELHSHKANKKEFIDELYKTANLPQYDIQNEAFDMEKKYSELEEQLKEYRSVLHQVVPRLNMSLYDIFARYLSLERPSFVFPIGTIENKSKDYLNQVLDLLHQYKLASDSLGYDYRYSPFYGFSCLDTNYIRYKAKDNFELLLSFFEDKLDTISDINKRLPLHLVSYHDLVSKVPFLSNFVGLNYFLPDYFIKNNRNSLLDTLESYLETKEYLEKSTLDRFFDLNILKEDVTKFTYDFKLASSYKLKWFKPSYHKLKKQINLYTKIKMRDSDLVLKLSEALEYLKKEELYSQSLSNLPSGYRPYEYELIYQDLCNLKDIPFDLDLTLESYRELKSRCLDILVHFKERNQLNLEEYTSLFDPSIINLRSDDLVKVTKILKKMNDQIDLLPVHAQRIDILTELSELDCLTFLNKAIEEKVDLNHLGTVYESLFLKANLYYEIDQYAILRKFTGLGVDELIDQFKRLSKVHLDANKAMIISKLSKQRPDGSILAGTEFAVLIREYNKSRRQKPIRLLLEEISSLILTIKPVFLMSPLSVSTYLKSELNMFDIVIFDEASQVFAWDAVGAIYRAKQCIIIGDSKQMPPSNFFNAIMNDEEEDNYDNDLESILDQGSSSFMTKRLNWHYRSRSEELIAFSNKAFYDSSLITIPQAKSHSKGFGVDYVYVNGIYEAKLRCNQIEAKTIVKLVFEHFDQNPKQSLGVVAFSNVQADLIAALIEDYLNEHQEYASFFREDVKEPFFVKNLETVQGDERDRIIFSICFGYNKDHQFYQRFGPLNNLGGERRLNVAITRAKYNITVVSSIHASDIRLENTASLGVKLLKEYLDYAEHVTTPSLVEAKVLDSSIEVIASYIESLGFLVEKSIGSSGFKIDIAVKHPLTQEYVVAIMLDGKTYCLGSCSDANYLQELLLNRLGWNYYRIFMPLWFEHEVEQKEKLKKYLNHLFNHAKVHKEEQLTNSKSYLVESKEEFDDCFEVYQAVTDEKIKALYQSKTTAQIINYIVKKEEPIHEEYLLKRICFMYGRTKVTNIVRELYLTDLNKLNLLKENNYLMSKEIGPISLRISSDRQIEYIHPNELMDAIYKVVKKSNGITKEGCYKTITNLLGYSRMSENAVEQLNNALVFLKLEGKIVEKADCLYV